MKWWRREKREAESPAADAVLAELLRQQADASTSLAGRGVAVEQAAGLWARAFASATVEPANMRTAVLTPSVLAFVGRMLALKGECVLVIDADVRGLRLHPCSAWDVRRGWRYRVDVPRPERTITRWLPSEGVVHPRYAVRPSAPWRGLSPLHFCPSTSDLAARVDQSLSNEYKGPVGTVLFGSELGSGFENDKEMDALAKKLASGKLVAFGTVNRNLGPNNEDLEDSGWLPPNDRPVSGRIGPEPPEVVAELRAGVTADVLAAFGVPPTLYAPNAASAREAWRQFLFATIQPVSLLVAEELASKLETVRAARSRPNSHLTVYH